MSIYIDQKMKEVLLRLAEIERRLEQLESKSSRPMIPADLGTQTETQRHMEQEKLDKRSREYRQSIGR